MKRKKERKIGVMNQTKPNKEKLIPWGCNICSNDICSNGICSNGKCVNDICYSDIFSKDLFQ
jgi:hypothetical protein